MTRDFLVRNNAGAFETLGAKVGLLNDMSACGFPADFQLRRAEEARTMTVDRVRELSEQYLDTRAMTWLVVGDARTQLPRLGALGLGPVTRLDRDGNPLP